MVMGGYRRTSDLPAVIPVFPLDGALLLPGGGLLPLQIFEPRYLNMIDDAMAGDRLIGMIQTRGGDRTRPGLAGVGCVGRITSYSETGDGRYLIALTGLCRFAVIAEVDAAKPYREVRADFAPFEADLRAAEAPPDFEKGPFLACLRRYLDARGLGVEWASVEAAPGPALVNSLAMALPFTPAEKQALLEAADTDARRRVLLTLMEIDSAWGEEDDGEHPVQ